VGLWDVISDAADAVGDAVSDAAEDVYDSASTSSFGDAIGWAGETVDTATFGLASRAMNAADDYVFDTVDYVTGGALNVDFDGGQFSVGAGFDGLAQVGASVGEAGMTTTGELAYGSTYELGLTDNGFTASGSAGIDWGPLPYAEGHMQIDANGDVNIGGRVQGTVPTPYGILSGEASGGFIRTDEGWGAFVDADGTLRMPSGTTIHGGIEATYMENADGSYTSVGLEGSVSMPGMGTAGGAVGYERAEDADGDVVEGFHAEGEVDALGISASAHADYAHSNIDGVEQSGWSGDVDFDGPDLSDATRMATQFAASELGADDGLAAGDVLGTSGVDMPPMDDFDSAIQTADSVDASMDDLVQDLQ
jgi:hypothetical protein